MRCPGESLPVFTTRQPLPRRGVVGLCLFLLACQECYFARPEQQIATLLILWKAEFERHTIVRQGLSSSVGMQRSGRSTLRVVDTAVPVITAGKVEGQFGKLRHAQSLLGLISRLKDVTNEPMKASTTSNADFGVEALTNFVMTEGEASRLIGSNEMCMDRLKKFFLNRFHLLLLYSGKQREIKGASNDGGHA